MSHENGKYYKAADKVQLIAPLLSETLSTADRVDLQKKIAAESGLSYRTVGRYVERFRKDKLTGLVASERKRDDLKTISDDIVAQAIILRRELPSRSIEDIIFILVSEKFVVSDAIRRSTLQRRLQQAGYSKRQMMQYLKTPSLVSVRRYQKEHRMMLLQGDIKYGPYLPVGPNGSPKQMFWIGWIDDATRYIVFGRFYTEMTAATVKDSFKMALLMCGKPDAIVIDNGSQYRAYDFKMCASSLGVKVRYCRPFPHKIFEVGKVAFLDDADNSGTTTRNNLGFLCSDSVMGFNEVSSLVNTLMYFLAKEYSLSSLDGDNRFIEGRCAAVMLGETKVGVFGEISPKVLENWGSSMPTVACEIDLDLVMAN